MILWRPSRGRLVALAAVLLAGNSFAADPDPSAFQPAELKKKCPYPPRTMEEIESVLGDVKAKPPEDLKALHIVLAAGKKDHGPETHDYPLWQRRWAAQMSTAKKVKVSTAFPWPSKEQFGSADAIVFFQAMGGLSQERIQELSDYLSAGGGAVFIHYGVNGGRWWEDQAKNVGLVWSRGSRYRHGKVDLDFTHKDHPITKGFKKLTFIDESYWALKGDKGSLNILTNSVEAGEPRPMLWTREHGKGRVFANILGHYTWTFDDPMFRILTLRGIAWVADADINRFNSLVTVGARVKQ